MHPACIPSKSGLSNSAAIFTVFFVETRSSV